MRFRPAALAAVLSLAPGGVLAESGEWDPQSAESVMGLPVLEIELDPPMQDAGDPFSLVGIEKGAILTHDLVQSAMQKLWLTGKVAKVEALAEALTGGGALLKLKYTHRLRIQSVSFKGNKKLKKKKLLDLVGFRPDMELLPDTVQSIESTLAKEYDLRGYPDASFLIEQVPGLDPGEISLSVTVIEGIPTRIAHLELAYDGEDPLEGPVPLNELRDALSMGDGDVHDKVRLDKGLAAIEAELIEAGHLNAIAGPPETLTGESGELAMRILVHAGPLLRFVIEGNDHLPDDEALAVMDPEAILPLDASLVEEMASRLADRYRSLGFVDASVVVHQKIDEEAGLLVYRFTVVEGPRVRVKRIDFVGNTHFKRKFLLKQVESYLYEAISYDTVFGGVSFEATRALLMSGGSGSNPATDQTKPLAQWPPEWIYWKEAYEKAVEHLVELYISQGYLGVQVAQPAIARNGETIVVTIVIDEGIRTFVESVDYEGNDQVPDLDLADATGIEKGAPFSGLGVKDAESAILGVYADRGYRFAAVKTDVVFSEDATFASVRYLVVEGPQVLVGDVLVLGNGLTSSSLVKDRAGLDPGEVFTLKAEQKALKALHELDIFRSVSIEMVEASVPAGNKTILIQVDERKPQYLALKGGASTGEGVRGSMEYAYRNLFGYALDFHFRIALNYRLFFVDVTDEFRDWYLSMPLIDQLERNVNVGLRIPHLPKIGRVFSLEFAFTHLRKNSSIYGITTNSVFGTIHLGSGKKFGLSIQSGLESSFINANSLVTEDLLGLPDCSQEILQLGLPCLNQSDKRALRIPKTDKPAAFVVTGGTLVLDFRDNPFNPTKGFSLNLSVSWIISPRIVNFSWYAPVAVGGQRLPAAPYRTGEFLKDVLHEEARPNILKFYGDMTGYISLGTPRLVLMLHTGGGIIVPLPGHTHTFPDRVFYLGGSRSLRGFPEESVCAQDEYAKNKKNGQCFLGGELMVILKVELRAMLKGSFGLAFFVDAGNLWHGWDDRYGTGGVGRWFRIFTDLRATAGMGIRYITPVGPINFDIGFLLNRREVLGEPIAGFHFSIGTF